MSTRTWEKTSQAGHYNRLILQQVVPGTDFSVVAVLAVAASVETLYFGGSGRVHYRITTMPQLAFLIAAFFFINY